MKFLSWNLDRKSAEDDLRPNLDSIQFSQSSFQFYKILPGLIHSFENEFHKKGSKPKPNHNWTSLQMDADRF